MIYQPQQDFCGLLIQQLGMGTCIFYNPGGYSIQEQATIVQHLLQFSMCSFKPSKKDCTPFFDSQMLCESLWAVWVFVGTDQAALCAKLKPD